jgi:hypothetical protein
MIWHDVRELLEPEIRDRRKHDAFAGNRIGQNDVERRESIRRDDQQALVVDAIDVAHLAARYELETRKIRFEQRLGQSRFSLLRRSKAR